MSEQKFPAWLRKPKHKKEVVATSKGWVVKETNELLVRVPNLLNKLADYLGTPVALEPVIASTVEQTKVDNAAESDTSASTDTTEQTSTEVTEQTSEESEKTEDTPPAETPAEPTKTETEPVKLNKDGTPRKKPGRKSSKSE